jgi:uncharacterized protein (DUF1800 family)
MIRPMQMRAAQAMIRFGLGRRGEETPPADPQGWLAAQLAGPDPAALPATLRSSAEALILLREQRRLKPPPEESLIAPIRKAEMRAQLGLLLDCAAPFRERLVWFWANHFTISIRQNGTAALVGAFVREAIRPHVTARFTDMLLAVMRHPAMLMYLDNQSSVGPDSPAGRRTGRGLNENLARECLELHTLGVRSGYSQDDVTAFARILTGWSVDHAAAAPGFVFRTGAHQPGEKLLLGRVIPEGEAGGVIALDMLANHPATRRHLAEKLVAHFVSDDPPADAVAHIAAVRKFRTPMDYGVAMFRALELPPERAGMLARQLRAMGQPLWAAPLPNGWSDRESDWASPDGMLTRIDSSYAAAGRADVAQREPMAVAQACLGPLLRPRTVAAIAHAGERRDALTLLFSSPEFLKR